MIRTAPMTPVSWRLGAGPLGHRRPRPAGADREALEQAGGQVRGADPDHLLVAADLLPGAGGERRRGGDRVGQRHQRDPQRPGEQRPEVGRRRRAGWSAAGSPWAARPTRPTPWSARSKTDAAAIASTTMTSTAGHLRAASAAAPGSARSRRSRPRPRRRPPRRAARPLTNPASSPMKPSASTENPNSFGSWPTRMVSARPFM